METFEPGKKCCWTIHEFKENEQGMKCLNCGRCMTNDAWHDKGCFCGSTNVVSAIARTTPATRLQSHTPRNSPTTVNTNNISNPTTPATQLQSHTSRNSRITTNTSNTSNTSTNSNRRRGWFRIILSIILIVLSIWGWRNNWFGLKNSFLKFTENIDLTKIAKNEESQQKQKVEPPPLSPKGVIKKYYRLAPVNRQKAIDLLSDDWKREELKKDERSFWEYVEKVNIYAWKTLDKTKDKAIIQVWLKYYMKDRYDTPCETVTFQVHLYESQGKQKWLLESGNDVIQKPFCEI